MVRIKATISYDGSRYSGFQIQPSSIKTVTGELYAILKTLGINGAVVGSGRTDSGVHATAQVIHFDAPLFWSDAKRLKSEMNRLTSDSLYIHTLQIVDSSFHARFSAKKRVYRYILSHAQPNPFEAPYVTFMPKVEIDNLNYLAKLFEGRHNFKAFKKSGGSTTSTTRTIFKSRAYSHKHYTILYFCGDAFLRSQIRIMTQALIDVSRNILTKEQLHEQLHEQESHSRRVAPPNGLYLTKVRY